MDKHERLTQAIRGAIRSLYLFKEDAEKASGEDAIKALEKLVALDHYPYKEASKWIVNATAADIVAFKARWDQTTNRKPTPMEILGIALLEERLAHLIPAMNL